MADEETTKDEGAPVVSNGKEKTITFQGTVKYDGSAGTGMIQLKLQPKKNSKGQTIGPAFLSNMDALISSDHFPPDFSPQVYPYSPSGRGLEHDTVSGEFEVTVRIVRSTPKDKSPTSE